MKASPIDPKLTPVALAILKAKIFLHPDAASSVKSWDEIKKLRQSHLLSVARQLNIDIDEAMREAKANPEASEFSIIIAAQQAEDYAFSGEIEFDVEMKMLGMTIQRRARVVYEHTPEWNHVSPSTGKERMGWGNSSLQLEIQAFPEVFAVEDGKTVIRNEAPCWTAVDLLQHGIIPHDVHSELYSMIDEDARRQDRIHRESCNLQGGRREES